MRLRGPAGPFGHSARSAMDVPARSSTVKLFAATQRVRSRLRAPKRARKCKVGQGSFHVKWAGECTERAFRPLIGSVVPRPSLPGSNGMRNIGAKTTARPGTTLGDDAGQVPHDR